ncbi:NAD(P)-dependent oxidoreductase [Emcibacter sp. SYSU 3D8]|uniref:precorrin-2 dehydrogenase/sirohydrochlorin ferrochelatase family protein n=1 Tax=Emcibacter sp. SYSU 3D8 TaxID=3133969 RepID=UPI0031FF36FE
MIPIMIDPERVAIVVAGNGPAAERRVRQAREGGARAVAVFAPGETDRFAALTDGVVHDRLPEVADLAGVDLLYVAGLDNDASFSLALMAREHNVLVNVEDVRELCDFHVPGSVRRGDLLIAVGTGGASPGLARRLRRHLEEEFGPEWAERLLTLSAQRRKWIEEGADMATVAERTDAMIEKSEWLK